MFDNWISQIFAFVSNTAIRKQKKILGPKSLIYLKNVTTKKLLA